MENELGDVYNYVEADAHPNWVTGVNWKPKVLEKPEQEPEQKKEENADNI